MHTLQIAAPILDGYKNEKLSEERINLLLAQVNEQLDEISQNKELYNGFLKEIKAPEKIDRIILWMLFMSNEFIVDDYISEFSKDFRDIIPVSDLADLLVYVTHLNKVQNIELDGFDYLVDYNDDGIEEMDQFCFTNVLLYIQKSKEVQIQF